MLILSKLGNGTNSSVSLINSKKTVQYFSYFYLVKNIFITGATGNIGRAVIKYLWLQKEKVSITGGVRNVQKAKSTFGEDKNLMFLQFDFENPLTYKDSLEEYDTIFLLRPPHISKVEVFVPLMKAIKKAGIKEIVFLSVQGADRSKVIPHNKIERLIKKYEIPYIFVRPSYFMQNLTTTLYKEIEEKRSITLPSGKAKFNWVDIEDIAACTAQLIMNFEDYKNKAYDITGNENESFYKVVELINSEVENKLTYNPVGPFQFYRLKKREGIPRGLIIVMLLLHYLPRFQKEPQISENVKMIIGREPTNLKEFIKRELELFN